MSTGTGYIEVRNRNQVTLPKTLAAQLQIQEGDLLEYRIEDGKIIITPKMLIPKEQSWFWTKAWQQGEKEVQRELDEKGPGKAYTAKDLLAEITNA